MVWVKRKKWGTSFNSSSQEWDGTRSNGGRPSSEKRRKSTKTRRVGKRRVGHNLEALWLSQDLGPKWYVNQAEVYFEKGEITVSSMPFVKRPRTQGRKPRGLLRNYKSLCPNWQLLLERKEIRVLSFLKYVFWHNAKSSIC